MSDCSCGRWQSRPMDHMEICPVWMEWKIARLEGQIKLMEDKARVSFGCFWNGGWYSIVEPPKGN